MSPPEQAKQRIDKWLWMARFFKTRGLATDLVGSGRVRIDGEPVSKPARTISPGQVLTFPQANNVRVVKILALAQRRGPASEAQTLYEDLTPPAPPKPLRVGPRPTGKDRRKLDADRRDPTLD